MHGRHAFPERLAHDRMSVRLRDEDGRLFVAATPISKACVSSYRGNEIPDAEAQGLRADRVYQLLRCPEELAAAASTFNGLPVLSDHQHVTAAAPGQHITVGALGTEARFEAPFLVNSMSVWDGEAITSIESGTQRELSCCYRYRADMTPGEFQGVAYDGVMRDLRGNHVALVKSGRAGPDVLVADSAMKPPTYPKIGPASFAPGTPAHDLLRRHVVTQLAQAKQREQAAFEKRWPTTTKLRKP